MKPLRYNLGTVKEGAYGMRDKFNLKNLNWRRVVRAS